MRRILFFTFFGYRDYISDIKESFEKHGSYICDLPYFQLKNDDKLSDQDIISKCADIVVDNSIDTIFMFLLPNVNNFIDSIKSEIKKRSSERKTEFKSVKFVFYNFDDPKSINIDIERYSRGIDYFFTPCVSSVSKLKCILRRENNLTHLPKYFKHCDFNHDDTLNSNGSQDQTNTNIADGQNSFVQKVINDKKTNDICILYNRKAEKVYDMKSIVKNLKLMAVDKSLTVKLFGEQTLEEEYPDIYEGQYSVLDVVGKVADSKVILYIKDSMLSDGYRDDVLNVLFASGAVVVTPYSRGMAHILRDEYNCFIFDKDTYLQKIYTCVINYSHYGLLRNNAKKSVIVGLNIDTWSDKILKTVK
ncbi:hypothetical protein YASMINEVIRUS_1049 [Yasminevirus sp. GU-2018]|uniref:Uncharacterized protein n=1 Tax=Yasminevirus sp. GU-2018 TaxID=2420051 RepID=A0A5K0UBR0_9VIRU|nr:hypothetical protein YASMINEVIRUS_1049 [Yasminevirus sp. GU-2018]